MNHVNIQMQMTQETFADVTKIFKKIDQLIITNNYSDFVRYCILHTINKKPTVEESGKLLVTAGDLCRFSKYVKEDLVRK